MKPRLKRILRFHRIVVICIVFSLIWIGYCSRTDNSKYANGQDKFSGRTEGGFNEGRWVWYFENGKKKMEGSFKKGKRTGVWKVWDENQTLLSERTYDNDLLNGLFRLYYPNAAIKTEGYYVNDKLVGTLTEYDTLGNKINENLN